VKQSSHVSLIHTGMIINKVKSPKYLEYFAKKHTTIFSSTETSRFCGSSDTQLAVLLLMLVLK